jgi:hypothetical protein
MSFLGSIVSGGFKGLIAPGTAVVSAGKCLAKGDIKGVVMAPYQTTKDVHNGTMGAIKSLQFWKTTSNSETNPFIDGSQGSYHRGHHHRGHHHRDHNVNGAPRPFGPPPMGPNQHRNHHPHGGIFAANNHHGGHQRPMGTGQYYGAPSIWS